VSGRLVELWLHLSASPLLSLTITLLAYRGAVWVQDRLKGHPLANPVLIATAALVTFLLATGTPYRTYFEGAKFIHFLLGPATVALAIPLHAQLNRLARAAGPLLVALVAGSAAAVVSAMGVARVLGASPETIVSLAPKSVTTPIAIGIAERIGGLPSLTSVLVVLTGVLGAVGAQAIFALVRCKDPVARGFSLGLASHGIGTARAFQLGEREGAFAALGMGLNGLLTALALPWLMPLLMNWLR
jgi:predicted murein hydrolase (TIGR00659 family)